MPFPLTDLKRSYGRSGAAGGPADVRPYLLAGRELVAQRGRLQDVIGWHLNRVNRRRQELDLDEIAQVAGDYRLARCLAACLQVSFRFVPPPFDVTVTAAAGRGSDGSGDGDVDSARQRLADAAVRSSSELRLRVFETVGAEHGGFVGPAQRPTVLAGLAAGLQLTPEALDTLLWLDGEANQRLEVVGPVLTPDALAAAYNRRALATLLVRSLSADLVLAAPDGATIRSLYFLVKRHGLLCDLELVDSVRGASGGVHVHLFGPLQIFGPRTRHGDRFAGVLLGLLYRFPSLRGSARVLLNDREYGVTLNADVAAALGGDDPLSPRVAEPAVPLPPLDDDAAREPDEDDLLDAGDLDAGAADDPGGQARQGKSRPVTATVARPDAGESFDSEVEAQLFATLRGMERGGDAAGWTVEREPEPLIHGTTVMVPDFALSRPAARGRPPQRVYVEVIGFWTPAYRERKRDKLRQFAGQAQLLVVVQDALASHFEDLPFPCLTYKQRVSAGELIRLLNRHYAGQPDDVATVRVELDTLLEAVDPALGLLGAEELRRALDLPTLGAVAAGVATAADGAVLTPGAASGWHWLAGVGMYHERWLRRLRDCCFGALAAADGSLALESLRDTVRASDLAAAHIAAEHLEALLAPVGLEVDWQSLFEASVRHPSSDC
ncbi:MAG: DUF790 family protein [Chloroflexota bacterium]|nr:DUF790 family protein [Chloroflexota bacterium]